MDFLVKRLTVLFTVIFLIAGFVVLPVTTLAEGVCKDTGGYFSIYCVGEGDSSTNTTINNNNTGTVAGDSTLGINSTICAFNEADTSVTGITDGALIRAQGDIDIYIVKYVCNKKFKRLILNPNVFESYGHLNWGDVLEFNQATLDSFTTSIFVRATSAGDPNVYMLFPNGDIGEKRWVTSEIIFLDNGWDWDAIYTINTTDRDAYINGQVINI